MMLYRRNGSDKRDDIVPQVSRAVSRIWHRDETCEPIRLHRKEGGKLAEFETADHPEALRRLTVLDYCAYCVLTSTSGQALVREQR